MPIERWRRIVSMRLRSLFRRDLADAELDEEIRFHVDHLIQEHLARGVNVQEAERLARLAVGGIEQRKEECRDARRVSGVENILKDLRYAVRTLRRAPAFTAAAIVSLALGIGANTAIFSFVRAVILKPLAYDNPDQLVVVGEGNSDTVGARTFLEWRT